MVFKTPDMPYADVSMCRCFEGNSLSHLTEFDMTRLEQYTSSCIN